MKATRLLTLITVLAIVLALVVPLASAAPVKPATAPAPITGYQIVVSSTLNYAAGGWAGWSCPAGKVVLGGGVAGVRTLTSRPAGPGSVWPHYTYGANEYGWVARSAEAGTAKIWVVCADAPAGYGIIESSGLNFNGAGGWGGWSCPANKVVLGGGVQDLEARTSRPAGPGSVWPHYAYGANEYGWVAQNGGVGTSGSKIAVVCASPVAGYQIVESAPLNYGPYGAAGWSCPAGTLVTGGGVQNLIARTSRPAGPGTVTDFGHTYGPAEYGWLANNGENAGAPGALIVPICAANVPTISIAAPAPCAVAVGSSIELPINFGGVSNVWGYQYEVNYTNPSPALVTVNGAFDNSFFDTTGAFIPGGWNANCAAGNCKFAATKMASTPPVLPVSGNGTVGKLTLTGVNPGTVTIGFPSAVLSDKDGNGTTPVLTGATCVVQSKITDLSVTAAPNPTEGSTHFTATPTGGGGGAISYVWNFGDGSAEVTTTGPETDHTYAPGTWTATVTATNLVSTKSASVVVKADTFLTGVSLSNNGPKAAGTDVTLTATAAPAGATRVTYTWDCGDGSATSTTFMVNTKVCNYAAAGKYTASVSVSNPSSGPFTANSDVHVYGMATVSGKVSLQGRATPLSDGTVTLTPGGLLSFLTVAPVSFLGADGTWTASVPALAATDGGTNYSIAAAHWLYLTATKSPVNVTAGGTFAQTPNPLRLLGGDGNNSGAVESLDLMCIGGAFGGPPVVCGSTPANPNNSSDINGDGSTNILDLSITGGNFGLTSSPW